MKYRARVRVMGRSNPSPLTTTALCDWREIAFFYALRRTAHNRIEEVQTPYYAVGWSIRRGTWDRIHRVKQRNRYA